MRNQGFVQMVVSGKWIVNNLGNVKKTKLGKLTEMHAKLLFE